MFRSFLFSTTALVLLFSHVFAKDYFVNSSGSDANSGTLITSPFKTIEKSIASALVGDFIYVAAGTYTYGNGGTLKITQSNVTIIGQTGPNGERPLLDFSSMPLLNSNYGIVLSGSNCKIFGLDIKGAGDNGLSISGNSNIIEFCSFFECRDTGCQLKGGATKNQIINCDSYYNVDASQGNADGFAGKLDVGDFNIFKGCRAWSNSDDGWDGYLRPADDITTTLENCWCFKNGYLKSGAASSGNGNGFKMGGSDNKDLRHNFIMKNCLAFDNRVKGFDQNNSKGSTTLLNCTAINNGIDYSVDGTVLAAGKALTVTNCLTTKNTSSNIALIGGIQTFNSWQSPFNCTADDFETVAITFEQATAKRKSDGSLPDISFMHLKVGSDLIDAGKDVGLPFNGIKPDLGCFETSVINGTENEGIFEKTTLFPNPTNGRFFIRNRQGTLLKVYNLQGKLMLEQIAESDLQLLDLKDNPAGMYVVALQLNGKTSYAIIILMN